MTFHIEKRKDGQWYFRIVASNYKTLAHSEGYWNKADAENAAYVIIREAGSGRVIN
jgi:uncharacterized protein YegP (UPF0339 family)